MYLCDSAMANRAPQYKQLNESWWIDLQCVTDKAQAREDRPKDKRTGRAQAQRRDCEASGATTDHIKGCIAPLGSSRNAE